jgi:hypothetical protein
MYAKVRINELNTKEKQLFLLISERRSRSTPVQFSNISLSDKGNSKNEKAIRQVIKLFSRLENIFSRFGYLFSRLDYIFSSLENNFYPYASELCTAG